MLRKYLGVMVICIALLAGAVIYVTWHASTLKDNGEGRSPQAAMVPAVTAPGASPTQQATATPSPQATALAAKVKPFDMTGATWVKYEKTTDNNGQPSTATVDMQYGQGMSGGTQGQLFTRTVTSGDSSYASTVVPGITYGLQVYSSQSSSELSSTVSLEQAMQDDPVMSADSVTGSPTGSGSITVPKGSFDCMIYTGVFDGDASTYWAAAGIPVPVQVYTAYDGTTYELIDWG